jgi:putative membrane protein
MVTAGCVVVGLAGLLHVFIFYLESVAWTSERARKIFGTGSVESAQTTKEMAFNQGFYNLFLAVMALVGVGLAIGGNTIVGATLMFAGAGSMLAAALVLLISSPSKAGAAIKQGVLPLVGVFLLFVGLLV